MLRHVRDHSVYERLEDSTIDEMGFKRKEDSIIGDMPECDPVVSTDMTEQPLRQSYYPGRDSNCPDV